MKAMVLAAGMGTRLGDLTHDTPKPMLPIQGHPLLAYILGHLQSQGFHDLVINLHFHPEAIREWLGDGSTFGLRVQYSHESSLLGTAGALRHAAHLLRNQEAFLVHYGDILTDQDFRPLLQRHRETNALATLLVHRRTGSNSLIQLDPEHRITGFIERPTETERASNPFHWVNSGICLCSPELLDEIPAGTPCDLPRDILVPLVPTKRLFAVELSGYRCAIDSPQRLASAIQAVVEGRCTARPAAHRLAHSLNAIPQPHPE